jgi:hypothetical protein
MLTIERCKKVLIQYGESEIADEEINQMKSILEDWARIEIEVEDEYLKLCQGKEQSSIQE